MLVLSGSHGAADLLAAAPTERPTHLGLDLRALLQPPLVVTADEGVWRCGSASASVANGTVEVSGRPAGCAGRHLGGGARARGGWPTRAGRSTR